MSEQAKRQNAPLSPDEASLSRRQRTAEQLGLNVPVRRIDFGERTPYSANYHVGLDERSKFIQVSHSVLWGQRSFLLCGQPGSGRSSFADQVAALRGAALVELDLAPGEDFELLPVANNRYACTLMVRSGLPEELIGALTQDCVVLIHDHNGQMRSELKKLESVLGSQLHGLKPTSVLLAGQLVPIHHECLVFFELSEVNVHPYASLPLTFVPHSAEAPDED